MCAHVVLLLCADQRENRGANLNKADTPRAFAHFEVVKLLQRETSKMLKIQLSLTPLIEKLFRLNQEDRL